MSNDMKFSRSGTTDLAGKCDELIRVHCPEATKDAVVRRATELGMSASELVRYWINVNVYGEDHVARVQHERIMGRRPINGPE